MYGHSPNGPIMHQGTTAWSSGFGATLVLAILLVLLIDLIFLAVFLWRKIKTKEK